MLDATLFQSNIYLSLGALNQPLEPWGAALQFCVPGNAYQCVDGRYVYAGALLDRHWSRLCELMGRPELAEAPGYADNSQRIANREVIDSLVAAWCSTRDSAEVVSLLDDAGLAVTFVNEYSDIAKEPYVREREMLVDVEIASGATTLITGPAVKFSRTPTSIRRRAPALGERTEELLSEVGVSADRYVQLRLAGVV